VIKKYFFVIVSVFLCEITLAQNCPVDPAINFKENEVVSLRILTASPILFDLKAMDRQVQTQIVSERRNQVTGSVNATDSQGTQWSGVLLKDFLLRNGMENMPSRGLRNARIEIIAKDAYKATFSWGEVFNSSAGSQILIITKQDGKSLDSQEGPVALRALSDIRPGPRHVSNVCAISVLN